MRKDILQSSNISLINFKERFHNKEEPHMAPGSVAITGDFWEYSVLSHLFVGQEQRQILKLK